MVERFQLAALWDARERSSYSYAEDVLQLMKALGASDPRLTKWYPSDGGAERTAAGIAAIEADLLAGRETWEHGNTQYTALNASYTNGEPAGFEVTLQIKCGIDKPSVNVWFPNRVDLYFFGPKAPDGFRDPALVERWLDIAVAIFEPRWAATGPKGFIDEDWEQAIDGRPVVSWMLYLSALYGPPLAAAPGSVKSMRAGQLVVTTGAWFDPADPAHVAAARALEQTLDASRMRGRAVAVV